VSSAPLEVTLDLDELRAQADEETVEAFRLADDLAAEVASHHGMSAKAAELASLYMRSRTLVRRLRTLIRVEVAG